MTARTTLADPEKLSNLIYDLELAKHPRRFTSKRFNIIAVPSAEYPELDNLFVIPISPVTKGVLYTHDARDAWIEDLVRELENLQIKRRPATDSNEPAQMVDELIHDQRKRDFLDLEDVLLLTILIPGSEPDKVSRFSTTRRKTRVRFLSALEHLWRDRLRMEDPKQRQDLLADLSKPWRDTDEEQFVEPAIGLLEEGHKLSQEALDQLTGRDPLILDQGLTVVYGPGGIGKTHFLRRLVWRYTRRSQRDPGQGIPVFAALPLLLHRDALENYLARRDGFGNLSLEQIRTMVRYGIVIPFLDAFDEMVRGTVREGCKEFLKSLGETMQEGGAGVLTSRDYFLHTDPLIPSCLRDFHIAELTLGYFNKQGRRSFIQRKTNLASELVARWSGKLESEVSTLFVSWKANDVDSLIGHPLFMDAFCNYVNSIATDQVAKAAESFRFRTPDVFGEIVERVLQREYEKAKSAWKSKFGDKFVGEWASGPFTPAHQSKVLTDLTLRVARSGGKAAPNREWMHGLFDSENEFASVAPELTGLARRKMILGQLLSGILPDPEVAPHILEDEVTELRQQGEAEIAEFYLQHTLSYTEPDAPPNMIFATRHRAYFEYFLARALVDKIYEALSARDAVHENEAINWSDSHHVFDDYSSCLEFLLWDPRISQEGPDRLMKMFDLESHTDDTIASYYLSLALALLLRRVGSTDDLSPIQGVSFAPDPNWRLELLTELLPAITGLKISDTSFPKLALNDTELRDMSLDDCEFEELRFTNCRLYNVHFLDVSCPSLRFSGRDITFYECELQLSEFDVSGFVVDEGATLHFTDCKLSESLSVAIDNQPKRVRDRIRRLRCQVMADQSDEPPELKNLSKGIRFAHKLMALLRKHGQSTWGVFDKKLRGRSGTGSKFDDAVEILARHDFILKKGHMILLKPEAKGLMFDGKRRPGRHKYEDVAEYWDTAVKELDVLLG